MSCSGDASLRKAARSENFRIQSQTQWLRHLKTATKLKFPGPRNSPLSLHIQDVYYYEKIEISFVRLAFTKGASINHVTQNSRSTPPRDASFTFSYLQMKICFSLYEPGDFSEIVCFPSCIVLY